MPSISCLAADSALTAVENKIPDTSNLVRKMTMAQKHQTLRINILLQLITINCCKRYCC